MNYNGTMYGFLYNVQGDVVALFNEDSDVTVRPPSNVAPRCCSMDLVASIGIWSITSGLAGGKPVKTQLIRANDQYHIVSANSA